MQIHRPQGYATVRKKTRFGPALHKGVRMWGPYDAICNHMHIHMHPCKFYMARYGFIMFFKVLYSVSMGASHSFYRLCSSMFTPPARSVLRWKIPQECGCQATPTLTVYSCGLPLLFCHSASKHQAFIISLNHVE